MYQCYAGFFDGVPCGTFQKSFSTDALNYWERSFFQRCRSIIEFDGLPEAGAGQIGWDYDAFMYQLFRMGYAVVFRSKKYGMVVQPGTPTGYGLQYQPRGMNITTQFFNFGRPLEIGTECGVIKLTPDYRGIWDIITKYAVEMQHAEVANRQSALFQRLANGEPAIVVNTELKRPMDAKSTDGGTYELPIMQIDRDLSKNFILPELMEFRRTILMDFYRELGIKVQPDKKERLNVNESQSADAETFNRREVWRICLEKSLDEVNRMYGTDITFKINQPDMDEGSDENAALLRNTGE